MMVRPSTLMPYLVRIADDESLVSDDGRCGHGVQLVWLRLDGRLVFGLPLLFCSRRCSPTKIFFYSRVASSFCPKLV